jgi:hypothetical protein
VTYPLIPGLLERNDTFSADLQTLQILLVQTPMLAYSIVDW